MSKQSSRKISLVVSFLAITSIIFSLLLPQYPTVADENNNTNINKSQYIYSYNSPQITQNAIISQNDHETKIRKLEKKEIKIIPKNKIWVTATAFSSTVDQCDSTPFITANGTRVHDGTLAANFLAFGTKVRFPSLYGDKIFTVEDRMKSNHKVDLWFPTRQEAKNFGAKWIEMEIL